MKNYTILITLLFLFVTQDNFSQSIIRKTIVLDPRIDNYITYSKHEIIQLSLFRPDDYDFAIQNQLGVIGNSFDKEGKIGKAPADPDFNINSHFPITGFKHTICGTLNSYYIRDFCSGDKDDDVHFIIEPAFGSRVLIEDVNQKIIVQNSTRLYAQTLPSVDLSKDDMIDIYNLKVNEINLKIAQMNSNANIKLPFMRTLKTEVLSEIDVHEAYKSYIRKFSDNVPKQELDCACSYGPWIHDVGTGTINPGAGFHDYMEIHPAEQVWWVNEQNNRLTYHCYLFNDNSGRFDEDSDFDTDGGNLSLDEEWTPRRLDGTFAIAFSYKLGTPKMIFHIERVASKNPLPKKDGLKHYLIFKRDTIAVVDEPFDFDIAEIEFEKVGLDPVELSKPSPDSVIKGFLVIKNSVGGESLSNPINNEREGNILFEITAANSIRKSDANIAVQKRVIIELAKMECRSIKEDEDYGEIYGYVGARVSSINTGVKNIAIFPSDKSLLLWSRLDQEGIPLKEGDVLYEMGSKDFIVDNDAVIEIKSDLNEDDSNTSNNETLTDDGDDQLSKDGKVKGKIFRVKDLSLNNPTDFIISFYNEGRKTEIILYFTITLQNLYEIKERDTE